MELKPSTQRALSLMAAALMAVIAFVVFVLLIIPEYQEIQNLKGELAGKSKLYQNQDQAFTQVQTLFAQYRGVPNVEKNLMMAMPTKEDVADIVNQLDSIARVNGTYVRSVSLDYLPVKKAQAAALVKDYATLRLSLKLLGSYAAFKSTLEDLETNIRVMDVTTLKIEPAGDPKENRDLFNFTLTVETYYQPE